MQKKMVLLALFCALFVTGALTQGPLQDRVIVDLPYAVTVQDKTLEPGEYVIQEPSTAGDSRVLQIYRDGGMVFETNVMTINALDNQTPQETSLQLQQVGDEYFLNKMWIAGKNYGYEFVLPDRVRERQQEMRESTITARTEHGQPLSNEASQGQQSAESAAAAGQAHAEGAAASAEQKTESAANTVEQGAESAAGAVEQGARKAGGAVERGAQSAAGAVERGAESAAGAAAGEPDQTQSNVAGNNPPAPAPAQPQASPVGTETSREAQSAAGAAGQQAGEAAHAVEQRAERAGNAIQEGARSAAGVVEREAEQAGRTDREDNLVAQNRGAEQPGQLGNEESQLPQTASPLALIALLGLGSLGLGAASRRRRK